MKFSSQGNQCGCLFCSWVARHRSGTLGRTRTPCAASHQQTGGREERVTGAAGLWGELLDNRSWAESGLILESSSNQSRMEGRRVQEWPSDIKIQLKEESQMLEKCSMNVLTERVYVNRERSGKKLTFARGCFQIALWCVFNCSFRWALQPVDCSSGWSNTIRGASRIYTELVHRLVFDHIRTMLLEGAVQQTFPQSKLLIFDQRESMSRWAFSSGQTLFVKTVHSSESECLIPTLRCDCHVAMLNMDLLYSFACCVVFLWPK